MKDIFVFCLFFAVVPTGLWLAPAVEDAEGKRREDITIVGAGISGTYAAWRLRQLGLRIGVYEYSDRVGGRMFTRQFADAPDLNVEFGAMRLNAGSHKRMVKAINDLGLTMTEFVEGYGLPNRTFYYLRNTHLHPDEMGTSPKTPYFLKPDEFRTPSELYWHISSCFTNFTVPSNASELADDIARINSVTLSDGLPLSNQSARAAFDKAISSEAFYFLRDYEAAHSFFGTAQSTYTVPAYPPSDGPPPPIMTVAEGLNAIPVRFLDQFLNESSKHHFHANRRLSKISAVRNGGFKLHFTVTKTIRGHTVDTHKNIIVHTRKVILAIPTEALKQVDWPPFRNPDTARLIDGIADNKASKVFLLYPNRWWLQLPEPYLQRTHTKSDLPNRQTYDFGESSNGTAILMASYVDEDMDVSFWNNLQKIGKCASRICDSNMVTDEVIKQAHIYLSQIYNVSVEDIPDPIDGMMQTWDEYPFYSAWGTWKPGFDYMQAFRDVMKPSPQHDVFVLNGHYAVEKYTAWGEGSLHSGDILLKRYFGVPQYIPTDVQ